MFQCIFILIFEGFLGGFDPNAVFKFVYDGLVTFPDINSLKELPPLSMTSLPHTLCACQSAWLLGEGIPPHFALFLRHRTYIIINYANRGDFPTFGFMLRHTNLYKKRNERNY